MANETAMSRLAARGVLDHLGLLDRATGSTLVRDVQRAPMFAIKPSLLPLHERELVPLTPAAERLLHGGGDPGMEQALRGWLKLTYDRAGPEKTKDFVGISMAHDAGSSLAARTAQEYLQFSELSVDLARARGIPDEVPAVAMISTAQYNDGIGLASNQWLHMDHQVTNDLARLRRAPHLVPEREDVGSSIASILRHEMGHIEEGTAGGYFRGTPWGEAVVNASLFREGEVAKTARALGIPYNEVLNHGPFTGTQARGFTYAFETTSLVGVLDAAGIDLFTASGEQWLTERMRSISALGILREASEHIIERSNLDISASDLGMELAEAAADPWVTRDILAKHGVTSTLLDDQIKAWAATGQHPQT